MGAMEPDPTPTTSRWNFFFKQLIVIGTLVGIIWVLSRLRGITVPVVLALLLAYLVSLPVNRILHQTGWPRGLVTLVTELLVVLLLLTTPAAIMPRLVNVSVTFTNTLVKVIQELLQVEPKPITIIPSWTIDLGQFYQPINQWLNSLIGPDLTTIKNLQSLLVPFAGSAAVVVKGAVSGIVWALFIFVFSFYLVKDGPKLGRFLRSGMPETVRPEFERLWRELAQIWDAFVRGQIALGVIMGVIVWIVMSILGVRSASALGLISGVMEFMPAVGPVIAAVPGILIAVFLGSSWLPLPHLWFALLVGLTYFLLQQLENLYLLPRIVGGRVRLHPAVVILGALAGAQLGGVLGILLAAPIIATLRLLLGYAYRKVLDLPLFPEAESQSARKLRWSELVQGGQIRAVLFDLDGTLIETYDAVVENLARRLRIFGRLTPEAERRRLARRWLMSGEVVVNGFVTLLDRLHLDGLLFRMNDALHRWRGIRTVEQFVAVTNSPEMLRVLAGRYRLAIVTSRNETEAQTFLAQYGLQDLVSAVVTRSNSSRLKPHPMPVRLAAEKLGIPVAQCVMVGDTNVDVRAAKAAGALVVGVLCGFGEREDFDDADLVLDSTAQLGEWV